MTHYICTGKCKGVTDHPRRCGSPTCELYDEPLKPCDCKDGKHKR